jgi:hypothetical protein
MNPLSSVILANAYHDLTPLEARAERDGAPRSHDFGKDPPVLQVLLELDSDAEGGPGERLYRWQVEVFDEGTRERAVALYRQDGKWKEVRYLARLDYLLSLTPAEYRLVHQ